MRLQRKRAFLSAAVAFAILKADVAHAQMSDGELFARASFLLLIPVGIAHAIVAAKLRSQLSRSRLVATVVGAILSVAAGVAVATAELSPAVIRWLVAGLCCVPGLPVAADLVRRRSWSVLVAAALPTAIGAVLVLA